MSSRCRRSRSSFCGFGTHFVPWGERAIGIAGGYLGIRIVSDGYYYLRGREGLGLGDAKLLALMGAALGWKALLPIVFFGSFLGILVGIPLLLLGRRRRSGRAQAAAGHHDAGERAGPEDAEDPGVGAPLRYAQVPFGPFLALGALGFLLFSDRLWPWLYAVFTGDYGRVSPCPAPPGLRAGQGPRARPSCVFPRA